MANSWSDALLLITFLKRQDGVELLKEQADETHDRLREIIDKREVFTFDLVLSMIPRFITRARFLESVSLLKGAMCELCS